MFSDHLNTTSAPSETDKQVDAGDKQLSLSHAARKLPVVRGKKPPHPNTLIRWAKAGLKSKSGKIVRLEIQRVGGTNCTSMAALQRFFDSLNDVEDLTAFRIPQENKKSFDTQVKAALKALKERGFLQE
jgi:hypothetical protein